MADMVRIKTYIAVNYIAGSGREDYVEISREDWEAMGPEDREDFLNATAQTILENHVEVSAYVEEEED